MRERIAVVLADDHPAVLDAAGRLLEAHGVDVVARVADGAAALDAIELHHPDVAVVDLHMPKVSGLEVAHRTDDAGRICIYTGDRERSLVLALVAAGVGGILLKEAPLADLAQAVRTVASGGAYFDPVLAGVLAGGEPRSGHAPLSERERSVLRFLADGYRHEAIGRSLHIAADTVRAHIRNAMRKLDADTRTQAVAIAMRRHLIE